VTFIYNFVYIRYIILAIISRKDIVSKVTPKVQEFSNNITIRGISLKACAIKITFYNNGYFH